MAFNRTSIRLFDLANNAYIGASVSFYTVSAGARTTTLATLYDATTGTGTLSNPQTLDAEGKFSQPVYTDVEVIGVITGSNAEDHETGISTPSLSDADVTTASTAATAAVAAQTAAETAETNAETAQAAAEAARDTALASVGGVAVSANDTTRNNLETKLLAGDGIAMTTQNDGGDETRTILLSIVDGSASAPGFAWADDDDTGFYRTGSGTVSFAADGTEVVEINANGIDLKDGRIDRAVFKDYGETLVTDSTGATYTIDVATANTFEITLTGNATFVFSNPPASGTTGSFTLDLSQSSAGSHSVTWPATVDWAGGSAPSVTSTALSVDAYAFKTSDGGTTWRGYDLGRNFS
jgi:hypothetical protein